MPWEYEFVLFYIQVLLYKYRLGVKVNFCTIILEVLEFQNNFISRIYLAREWREMLFKQIIFSCGVEEREGKEQREARDKFFNDNRYIFIHITSLLPCSPTTYSAPKDLLNVVCVTLYLVAQTQLPPPPQLIEPRCISTQPSSLLHARTICKLKLVSDNQGNPRYLFKLLSQLSVPPSSPNKIPPSPLRNSLIH